MISEKPTLIYVTDPLCGWCYGFQPVLDKIMSRFSERLHFELMSGGLAISDPPEKISDGYAYLYNLIPDIEKITGRTFGDPFKILLEEGSYLYNSEPPSVAQTVMKQMQPQLAFDFSKKMQSAFFKSGANLNKWDTYEQLLKDYEIDKSQFKKHFSSSEYRHKTYDEFARSRKCGANGFPALILKLGDEYGIITKGYRPFDTIESHLHYLLNNLEKIQS